MNTDIIAMFAKTEAVEGVAEVLATTDAVPVVSPDISIYDGDKKKSNQVKPLKGANKEYNSDPHNSIKFGVEVIAQGSAAIPSKQSDLMLSCGYGRVIDATVTAEKITHSLISGNGTTQTIAHKQLQEDGKHMTFVSTGCRGNMSAKISKGELPQFDFDFKGKYNTPTEDAVIVRDVSGWKDAIPSSTDNTPTVDVDGFAVCFEQFNFNSGVNINRPKLVGCDSTLLGTREFSGNIIVKAYDLNVKNYFTKMESHNAFSPIALNIIHGTVQYSILEFLIANAQIGQIKRTSIDDVLAWDIPFTVVTDEANLSEIVITER